MAAPSALLGLDAHKALSQYVQTRLTDQNGLPQSSVSAIAQTKDGYLWFGTEEGLARYDGTRVTVFDTASHKELKDNLVLALRASRDGSLWVGTRSSVSRYKDGVFRPYISAASTINSIFESSDGRIWVASMNGLYVIKDGQVRLFGLRDGLPDVHIYAIAQGPDGTLWLGTDKGLVGLGDFKHKVFHTYGPAEGLPNQPVMALAMCRNGSLWLGMQSNVLHWKGSLLGSWVPPGVPKDARIGAMLADRDGAVWVGYTHNGLAVYRNGGWIRSGSHEELPSQDISSLFEDGSGHVWIGMLQNGVAELRDGIFSNLGVREGLAEDRVWSVIETQDGSMWVGTNSKGLEQITTTGAIHHFTTQNGLPAGPVYSLMEARDGSLWMGFEDGALAHFKDGHFTVFRDPKSQRGYLISIRQEATGDLLLGFHEEDGLVRFRDGSFQHYKLPGMLNVSVIASDGSIWVGADHSGITHIQGDKLTNYTTKDGLLSNFSQTLYLDRDGVLWAGTSPGGLNRIKNGRVTTYSVAQGLYGLTIGAIVEDDFGNLWMTCNKGIFRVSKKELNDYADGKIKAVHSEVYGTADGMRKAECNFGQPSAWKSRDGHLWFTTTAGIASADERRIVAQDTLSAVLVEEVLYRHAPVVVQNSSVYVHGSGDLEFRFTSPNFEMPDRLRFRYRLEGFDNDWIDIDNRRIAYYTKLPPGHYSFRVQTTVGDADWNAAAVPITIMLEPHLWQTVWFRGFCGLLLLLIFVSCYRVRIRYLMVRTQLLEKKVEERTQELQEAVRVTEAAHQALHDLAMKDGLTKLWNRRTIFEILHKEAARATRDRSPVCVLMADVDHFKVVNDLNGHMDGDSVLQEVARRITQLTRTYDAAGRYGGEEFLIILPGCSLEDGYMRAEEFRAAIANTPFVTETASLQITCSFGVAASRDLSRVERLVRDADNALYKAKRAGRNCVLSTSPEASRNPVRDQGCYVDHSPKS
ncbi:ligand-binding sensor domain-containing diguanylate cyclase [Granulicella arctica]|uniref:ligand-binding sensor domain-containing diguanylate cyclase n=1 Tax=Granulicella arctica TaxID=940613 RepID=UPI0021E0F618|nr:ligand-binding sensor domain-containing diguanylate cyclase [Granulicella arctica]